MAIRGFVFDAYGTLFDVHSVIEAGLRYAVRRRRRASTGCWSTSCRSTP
jgi:FMN phosphatase YigB (HAD superfamily)